MHQGPGGQLRALRIEPRARVTQGRYPGGQFGSGSGLRRGQVGVIGVMQRPVEHDLVVAGMLDREAYVGQGSIGEVTTGRHEGGRQQLNTRSAPRCATNRAASSRITARRSPW